MIKEALVIIAAGGKGVPGDLLDRRHRSLFFGLAALGSALPYTFIRSDGFFVLGAC